MSATSTAMSVHTTVLERDDDSSDALREILKQVGENGEAIGLSMDLLGRIIQLLLPKATGDGPTIGELLTALLTTMRELLIVERSNANGIDEILSRLDTAGTQARTSPGARG